MVVVVIVVVFVFVVDVVVDDVVVKLIVPLNPKMDRGSTGSGLTTAKRGKNLQA